MDELQPELIPASDKGEPSADTEQWSPLDWLHQLWAEVSEDTSNLYIDPRIDRLVNADIVSVRYMVLTQLLGKFMDHRRDALSLQRGERGTAEAEGRWNPRTFCERFVVPWVAETGQVLGTSGAPYVSNPLRRPRIEGWEPSTPVGKEAAALLIEVLAEVQEQDHPKSTERQLRRCIASVVKKYNELNVSFSIPHRLSLEDTMTLTMKYLSEPSGGERLQIITAALMRLVGERFQLFDEVERQAINEADAARGRSGDITCSRSDGTDLLPVLSIEVKDRAVILHDIEATIEKARAVNITEVLFVSAEPQVPDPTITDRVRRAFSSGLNIYQSDIRNLLQIFLTMGDETSRTRFLSLVGEELNDRVTQPDHKLDWADLLRNL